MTDLVFFRPNGGVFKISSRVLSAFDHYRQKSVEPEAGGVLLGRIYVDIREVIADTATVPTSVDQRTRFRFVRARKPAQVEIERAWNESEGLQNYLGEWHTHPEDCPHPSSIDIANWLRLTKQAVFEQDSLFFVIVGRVEIKAWEMRRGGGPAVLLAPPAIDVRL